MEKTHTRRFKNKIGRPIIITEERVRKLEEAFKVGLNVKEACIYAVISRETYYCYRKKNRGFSDRVEASRKFLVMAAKKTIAKAIIENGSVVDSWKYLEKKDKDLCRREWLGTIETQTNPIH